MTFEKAAFAFLDQFAIEWIKERAAYSEERVILLGISGDQILSFVYTERGERLRIISARKATKYEKDHYYRLNSP